MNVILLEKMANLGEIGDTANVKSGFARNFLFPKGKAIPASKQNLADFEGRRAELMAAHDSNVAAAQKRQAVVADASLNMQVNASDEGKLFGSVGTQKYCCQTVLFASWAALRSYWILATQLLRLLILQFRGLMPLQASALTAA
jgi:ribosomal protein L9